MIFDIRADNPENAAIRAGLIKAIHNIKTIEVEPSTTDLADATGNIMLSLTNGYRVSIFIPGGVADFLALMCKKAA